MSEITRVICDICKTDADPKDSGFVDAGVYGAHMHLSCLRGIDAIELIRVLGLDEITFGPNRELLIYSKHVQSNRK